MGEFLNGVRWENWQLESHSGFKLQRGELQLLVIVLYNTIM